MNQKNFGDFLVGIPSTNFGEARSKFSHNSRTLIYIYVFKAWFRYLLICFLSNWYLVKSKVLVKSCVTPSIWQIGSCLPVFYGVLVKNTSTLWQETEINWARTSAGKQLPICQIDGVNKHFCPTSTKIFVQFHCMATRWPC